MATLHKNVKESLQKPYVGFEYIQSKRRHVFAVKINPNEQENSEPMRLGSHRRAVWAWTLRDGAVIAVRLGSNRTTLGYLTATDKMRMPKPRLINRWLLARCKLRDFSRISTAEVFVFQFGKPAEVFVIKIVCSELRGNTPPTAKRGLLNMPILQFNIIWHLLNIFLRQQRAVFANFSTFATEIW